VLVNPANGPAAETTLQGVQEAARVRGLQIQVIKASTSREIDAAFATLVRERADATAKALVLIFPLACSP
jgi:DNA-binding LacI/PurR family transcriptional regulator